MHHIEVMAVQSCFRRRLYFMTKRNRKTKSGLQSAKSINDMEFSKEMTASEKKAEKQRPH
jgi:hypothetical protein